MFVGIVNLSVTILRGCRFEVGTIHKVEIFLHGAGWTSQEGVEVVVITPVLQKRWYLPVWRFG